MSNAFIFNFILNLHSHLIDAQYGNIAVFHRFA